MNLFTVIVNNSDSGVQFFFHVEALNADLAKETVEESYLFNKDEESVIAVFDGHIQDKINKLSRGWEL